MTTVESIAWGAWGLLNFIALIVWLRWMGTWEDQKKDEPHKGPKRQSGKVDQSVGSRPAALPGNPN
ncbi:MAG: hypothetical protein WB689_12385 [Xanthobacteraceae bacterium]